MSVERSKRTVKPPRKFEEIEDDKPQRQTKHIFRLLTKSDLTKEVLDKELFILWPDNAQWYAAEIIKLDLKTYIGTIAYTETEEEEKNVKVMDLVKAGEIAFKERKPVSYNLKKGELDAPDPTPQRSDGEAEGDGGFEDPDEENIYQQAVAEDSSAAEDSGQEEDEMAGQMEKSMQDEAKHRCRRSSVKAGEDAGSGGRADAKRSKPVSADAEPAAPVKRAKAEPQAAGKRQVLPTEKAMQLLREGKAGSGDFSAADAASRKLLRSLMEKRAEAKQETSGQAFYGGRQAALKANVATKPSKPGAAAEKTSHNATLQARYVELIKGHLDKAAVEAKAAGREGANIDTKALAARIDDTMHKHFGGYNEEFRGKMRSVLYNLKDDKNQDFRRKVLRGEVSPTKICHMESHDMASEEQQEWRRKREEESLKNSVLDSAAAARFSTAAALEAAKEKGIAGTIDWRTSTLAGDEGQGYKKETQEDKKENPAEETGSEQSFKTVAPDGLPGAADPASHGDAVKEEFGGKPSTPSALEGRLSSWGATSLAATSSFDWAKIKERAREEAANAPAKAQFETFNDFGNEDEATEQPADDVADEEPEAAPLSAEAARWQAVPDLAPIIASCTGSSPNVWSGSVSGIASKPLAVTADYLAGPADIAALLGQQAGFSGFEKGAQVHIKGRMPFDRVERFCEELRHSRRRTCSVAIIRSKHGPKQEFTDAAAEYSSRGRCGISDISGGVEGYLVPPSDLAERLIKTAYLAEGRDLRRKYDGLPEELGTNQMLLLLVHLKDWGQHLMHTEQALQKASPLHVASPERAAAENASVSPAHVPGAVISPHHASASLEEGKLSQGTPVQYEGQPASPAHAEAPLQAPGPQARKAMDPRQRSADPRQRSADPRRAAAPAQAPPGSPQPQPKQAPPAAPAAIDFGALGALAQALGVGLSMPAPAVPQPGQALQSGGFPSSQSVAPQHTQQQPVMQGMQQALDSLSQFQHQPQQQQQPARGQPGQPGQPSGAQGSQQLQHWPLQGTRPGPLPMQQQQGQPQQLPGPPPIQQHQQAWQPQPLQQPPAMAPPQQSGQSPMHGQGFSQQPPQLQQLGQQAPHQAPSYQGRPAQHAGQQRPPLQLPVPQPLPRPAGQLPAAPRLITLARPGQPHQQHGPRPQQPITLPPPGQQHAQPPPRPITLQAPAQRGAPPVQHPQPRPPQAPITLRPPGPITLKPPGGPRPQSRGGQGGRGGGRGRADGRGKPSAGRLEEGSGQPASKRPRVMGPGAKAVAGFQG